MISPSEMQLPNLWVRRVAFFATAVMVVWIFAGWIIAKGWTIEGLMLAAMSAALQALGWNASAQMRRADAVGANDARSFWRWTLIVCACWTAFSAHAAYGVIARVHPTWPYDLATTLEFVHSGAALILLTAWAFIEPLLGWAIEKTERPDAHTPPTAEEPRPQQPARPTLVASAMAAAAIAALPLGAHSPMSDNAARAQAVDRFRSGERNAAAIARELGVPGSTVRRWVARLR